MNRLDKEKNDAILKNKPTIFPMGFTISVVEKQLIIIEFIDTINGERTVIESIALTADKAHQLSATLTQALSSRNS
jgi:hypothetical protein